MDFLFDSKILNRRDRAFGVFSVVLWRTSEEYIDGEDVYFLHSFAYDFFTRLRSPPTQTILLKASLPPST